MLPAAALAAALVVALAGPVHAQSAGGPATGVQLAQSNYYDPGRPLRPQPRWQTPRQSWEARRQQQIEQERRWRAEQERRWRAWQQQRRNQWQRNHGGGWQRPAPQYEAPPAPAQPETQRSADRQDGGPRPDIAPQSPEVVAFANDEAAGTIIIDTRERHLYYTLSQSEAYRYPVSVGREGFNWHGTERVSRVAAWPDWHPPESMREREPHLPKMMTGGINNPLGARAIYLGDTLYRIHGTNQESSIGQAASSGCFRMRNEHVVHLAQHVTEGAKVMVVDGYNQGGIAQAGEPG